eukprot:8008335-Prorocentrum_lima.AAC.1
MTSSLVGSEMCIRDRWITALIMLLTLRIYNTARTGGETNGDDPEQIREPVSYTHLTLPTICSV